MEVRIPFIEDIPGVYMNPMVLASNWAISASWIFRKTKISMLATGNAAGLACASGY